MRRISLSLTMLVALTGCFMHATPVRAQEPACSPDTASQSSLKAWVTMLSTAPASDTQLVARRQYLQIPAVAANQVTVITTASTCQSVRTSYAQSMGVSASGLSVVVVKAGSVYVTFDPSKKAGEWTRSGVYSLQFQQKKMFLF